MVSYLKGIGTLFVAAVAAYIGLGYYQYYTSDTAPIAHVIGLAEGDGIARDTRLEVRAQDAYKVGSLEVLLDGEPLVSKTSFSSRSVTFPFVIMPKELKQGAHTLTVLVANAAQQQKTTTLTIPFYVDTVPLQAALTKHEADARVYQGRTLHVEFQANKEIREAELNTLSETYPCYLQSHRGYVYECFVPIDCEEVPQEYPYTVRVTDYAGDMIPLEGKFRVVSFPFKKQTIRVEKDKIKQENDIGRPEHELEEDIERLTKASPKKKLWHGSFIVPLELKDTSQITTDFGVIRATQERGLNQHKALDLIAPPRSVIWAPQDGVVVIKDRYAHSGNTVAIDHGHGVMSLLFHLDEFAPIEVGRSIKKGKPVGTLGKTGYATGYHLHWEMRVGTVPVDPYQWTKPQF